MDANYVILAAGQEVCVVVEQDCTTFRPLIFKSGDLYDPENGFRPVKPRYKQKCLGTSHQREAEVLITVAQKVWTPPTPKESPEPKKDPAAVTPPKRLRRNRPSIC